MKPIRSPRRDRADEWQIVAQRRVFEMVLSRVNRSAAIIALVGVRGTGKTTICGQIMIKLARRWSELVQCELVGFVLLVQHQRTYASQLMSDSHEPDVVLCAEVRIDRLQRFNDFNQLEIDPESNRWLALSFRRRYEFLERALRFGTKLERLIRRQSCDCCAVSSLTPLNCAGSKPQSSGSRQTVCRSAVSSRKIPTRKSSTCSSLSSARKSASVACRAEIQKWRW
jgi:hypothetical protein